MTASLLALLAVGHLFTFQGKPDVLLMLPAGASACGLGAVSYGTVDNKFSKVFGPPPKRASCEFRQSVKPGDLVGYWDHGGGLPAGAQSFEVAYTVQSKAGEKDETVTLSPEPVAPAAEARLQGRFAKGPGRSARVELTNAGDGVVLVGDAVAARNKPSDACRGAGPTAALAAGETLIDTRPGLVSKSMQVWVAVFRDLERCAWVKAAAR